MKKSMKVYKSFLIILPRCFYSLVQFSNDDYAMNYKVKSAIYYGHSHVERTTTWMVPYVLGGVSRRGVDCSVFVQKTFFDRFNLRLPRSFVEQANYVKHVHKEHIQTGDLIFFKTGPRSNGYHGRVYVKKINSFMLPPRGKSSILQWITLIGRKPSGKSDGFKKV